MLRHTLIPIALLLAAPSLAKCLGDDAPGGVPVEPPPPAEVPAWEPVHEHPLLGDVPPFRTTALAAWPTDGGLQPSRGYAHYELPSRHYGIWFRPTSFGRQCPERCAPAPFNPRGFGNLFARSSVPYRMDYDPYVLVDANNAYGPAYMVDPVPYRCAQRPLFCRSCREHVSGGLFRSDGGCR